MWSDGQTTQTANNLSAGNYSCIVTDANGCNETTTNIIITEPQAITFNTSSTNITCHGLSDGSATVLNASGGVPFSGVSVSQVINWTLSCGGGNFAVQYRVLGATSWTPIPGNTTSSSTYTLTGLTSSTSYEWRVKCQGTPWAGTPVNFLQLVLLTIICGQMDKLHKQLII